MERQIEQGDIAEAEQGLRVRPNSVEVDQIKVCEGRPAAGRREDRADVAVAEQLIEFGGHLLRPGSHPPVAPLAIDQRSEADAKTECLDDRDRPVEQRHLLVFQ